MPHPDGMHESKYPRYRKPHPPGTPHDSPHGHLGDKSDMATNLANPGDYQTNGFKKHRDTTPV